MQYHSRASVPQFSRRCSRRLSSIHAADIAAHSKSRETHRSELVAVFRFLSKWHFGYWQEPPYGFAIGSDVQHLTCESTRPSVRITQRTPLHLTVFLRRRMISSVELRIRGNGELASLRKTLSIVRRNHNSQRSGSLINARLTQNGLWLIDKIAEQGTTKNHEAVKEYSRQYHQLRTAEDPLYKLKRYIRIWIARYEWIREGLDWTPWRPIFYPTKVQHRCQGCGAERHRGSRLW
jgi:hypothetical protein